MSSKARFAWSLVATRRPRRGLDHGDLERTALREIAEETNLKVKVHLVAPRPFDVDVHLFPERDGFAAHYHLDVRFLLLADDPELLSHRPSESHGARWFTWNEALEQTEEEAMRRMLTKAQTLLQPR